jgi:hypothetical protein
MKIFSILAAVAAFGWTASANAEVDSKQTCEEVAALTGDAFHRKLSGEDKQTVRTTMTPPFKNPDFNRKLALAIDLAFKFDNSEQESAIEEKVYQACLRSQQ